MIFLIEYDRAEGSLVSIVSFDDADRSAAESTRLALELALNRKKIDHEVVLLEAADEDALHRTHRRYFEDLADLARLPSA